MLRVFVAYLLVGLFAFPVQAQYALRAERAGPGHAVMEGGGYALQGAAGQPAARIVGNDPYLGAGFWYAVRNEAVALPIELTAFEAVCEQERVVLTWETASETNSAGFEVERSVEGLWKTVTFVPGGGTTSEPQTYRYADDALPYAAETVFYRLKQIDTDGAFEYSDEVEVERGAPERLALHPNYPNPFRAQTTIRYEVPQAGPVRIVVYDMVGRRVGTLVDGKQPAGRKEVVFDARRLASGVYFVRLQAQGQTLTRKLTVVR